MVDDWENPAYRENEQEGLTMLLKDINKNILTYVGTTKKNITRVKNNLTNNLKAKKDITKKELYNYYFLLSDYCVGRIINSNGIEQMKYYRRLEKLQDQMDKIDELIGNPLSILEIIN